MIKDPIAPEGMQFVNSNNLVDFKDIDNFRNKFLNEINYLWDILLDNYNTGI